MTYVSLTPKAVWIEKQVANGKGWADAMRETDAKFTDDGMRRRKREERLDKQS